MSVYPTLYKITATGKVQVWRVWTEGSHIFSEAGQFDGAMTESNVMVTDRKNSPTIEKQADLMAASKWNNKRKTYWESIDDARKAGSNLTQGGYAPMLAHTYTAANSKFSFPCLVQPKLDGLRCISRKIDGEVSLWSRKGLPIDSVPHINRSLGRIMEDGEIFDGELYNHGSDFNVSSGKIRATNGKHDTSGIDYWVYDVPRISHMTETDPFVLRMKALVATADDFRIHPQLYVTPTAHAKNFSDVQAYHDEAVEKGFEGAILRNPNMRYENKRSQNLLKYKAFFDEEYEIVGCNEGVGVLEEAVGSFTCLVPNVGHFNCKLKATNDVLRAMWGHPELFMHKFMTVKFQNKSAYGIPRFPVGIRIR